MVETYRSPKGICFITVLGKGHVATHEVRTERDSNNTYVYPFCEKHVKAFFDSPDYTVTRIEPDVEAEVWDE